jgi:uncharacterized protein (TIGR00369 family)
MEPVKDLAWIAAQFGENFPKHMGIRFLSAEPTRVQAELDVRPELCTTGGRMHGGALMAFADTLGAAGTVLNLPAGAGTTTIESKTNFIAAAPEGDRIVGDCTPIHRGGTTQIWQTRITRSDGRLVAVVTQTQIVLQPRG